MVHSSFMSRHESSIVGFEYRFAGDCHSCFFLGKFSMSYLGYTVCLVSLLICMDAGLYGTRTAVPTSGGRFFMTQLAASRTMVAVYHTDDDSINSMILVHVFSSYPHPLLVHFFSVHRLTVPYTYTSESAMACIDNFTDSLLIQ